MPPSGKCRIAYEGACWQAPVGEPCSAYFHLQPHFVARQEMIMTEVFEQLAAERRNGSALAFVPSFIEQMRAQG